MSTAWTLVQDFNEKPACMMHLIDNILAMEDIATIPLTNASEKR